jgi:hypothetical protein
MKQRRAARLKKEEKALFPEKKCCSVFRIVTSEKKFAAE